MSGPRRLVDGFFFPLDVARALDMSHGVAYSEECARRALRERHSARRLIAQRAHDARQREQRSQARGGNDR